VEDWWRASYCYTEGHNQIVVHIWEENSVLSKAHRLLESNLVVVLVESLEIEGEFVVETVDCAYASSLVQYD
jgi:hypothetical protein